jgi:hypothetical protein
LKVDIYRFIQAIKEDLFMDFCLQKTAICAVLMSGLLTVSQESQADLYQFTDNINGAIFNGTFSGSNYDSNIINNLTNFKVWANFTAPDSSVGMTFINFPVTSASTGLAQASYDGTQNNFFIVWGVSAPYVINSSLYIEPELAFSSIGASVATNTSQISLTYYNLDYYYSSNNLTYLEQQGQTYNNQLWNVTDLTTGQTTTSTVPVPAAVWLFGSALAGLIGFNRKKSV